MIGIEKTRPSVVVRKFQGVGINPRFLKGQDREIGVRVKGA
jgi:hypothetical protein